MLGILMPRGSLIKRIKIIIFYQMLALFIVLASLFQELWPLGIEYIILIWSIIATIIYLKLGRDLKYFETASHIIFLAVGCLISYQIFFANGSALILGFIFIPELIAIILSLTVMIKSDNSLNRFYKIGGIGLFFGIVCRELYFMLDKLG